MVIAAATQAQLIERIGLLIRKVDDEQANA